MSSSDNLTPISSLRDDSSQSGIDNPFPPEEKKYSINEEPKDNAGLLKKLKIAFYIFSILVFVSSFSYFVIYFYLDNIKEFSSSILYKIKNPTVVSNNKNSNVPNTNTVKEETFFNPINGLSISKDLEQDLKTRKPVSIMLNNHVDARPQAGIQDADIIYEISAEGGISRLMPIFYSKLPQRAGSVRSARIYFMQVAAEYNPIFSHWGVAYRPDAEKNLSATEIANRLEAGTLETDPKADARTYGDSINLPVANTDTTPNLFYRESGLNVAIEHTGFAKFSDVYTEFKKFYKEDKWSAYEPFTSWKFTDKDFVGTSPVSSITYNFWDLPDFEATFTYDPALKMYKRVQGGKSTIDRNTSQAISVKTLIVQKAVQTHLKDKKKHLLFDVIGSGNAVVYTNGTKLAVTWKKPSARERTIFYKSDGSEVEFPRGLIWVAIIPSENTVTEK